MCIPGQFWKDPGDLSQTSYDPDLELICALTYTRWNQSAAVWGLHPFSASFWGRKNVPPGCAQKKTARIPEEIPLQINYYRWVHAMSVMIHSVMKVRLVKNPVRNTAMGQVHSWYSDGWPPSVWALRCKYLSLIFLCFSMQGELLLQRSIQVNLQTLFSKILKGRFWSSLSTCVCVNSVNLGCTLLFLWFIVAKR